MADAEVIKEFLVSLGYKHDDTAQQRAERGMRQTGESAQQLQTSIRSVQQALQQLAASLEATTGQPMRQLAEANRRMGLSWENLRKQVFSFGLTAATATAGFLLKMREVGKSLADLGVLAQRTGTTAKGLDTIAGGMRAIGRDGKQAHDAMNTLAQTFRRPGGEATFLSFVRDDLSKLPAELKDADHNTKLYAAGLEHIAQLWKQGRFTEAQRFGRKWYGFDADTVADVGNNIQKYIGSMTDAARASESTWGKGEEGAKRQKQATDDARAAQEEWGRTTQNLRDIWNQSFATMAPHLTELLKTINSVLTMVKEFNQNNPWLGVAMTFGATALSVGTIFKTLEKITGIKLLPSIFGGAKGEAGALKGEVGGVLDGLQQACNEKCGGLRDTLGNLTKDMGGLKMAVQGVQMAALMYAMQQKGIADRNRIAEEMVKAGAKPEDITQEQVGQRLRVLRQQQLESLPGGKEFTSFWDKTQNVFDRAMPRFLDGMREWMGGMAQGSIEASRQGASSLDRLELGVEKADQAAQAAAETAKAVQTTATEATPAATKRSFWDKVLGRNLPATGAFAPSAQEGGIVNINAHEGEMILPKTISQGFQRLFSDPGSFLPSAKTVGRFGLGQAVKYGATAAGAAGPAGMAAGMVAKGMTRGESTTPQHLAHGLARGGPRATAARAAIAELMATGGMLSAQEGGIVPIGAHPGEMVLPKALSEGMQRLISGGGSGERAMKTVTDKLGMAVQQLSQMARGTFGDASTKLGDWVQGRYGAPKVVMDNVTEFAREFADAFQRRLSGAGEGQVGGFGAEAPAPPATPGGALGRMLGGEVGGAAGTATKFAEDMVEQFRGNKQQQDFIRQYAPLAQAAAEQTGLDPRVVLAQAAAETGWGQSRRAQQDFNMFGMGGPGRFRKYGSAEESFADYAKVMMADRYAGARAGGSVEEQVGGLVRGGYTKDRGYSELVTGIANRFAVQKGGLTGGGAGAAPTFGGLPAGEGGMPGMPEMSPTSGRVTSSFGTRADPLSGRRGQQHHGVDIGGNKGEPIVSTGGGKVIKAGWNAAGSGYGYSVKVQRADGSTELYGHLASMPHVKVGQEIGAGAGLGIVGSTGKSTGAHLHYARYDAKGRPINLNDQFAKGETVMGGQPPPSALDRAYAQGRASSPSMAADALRGNQTPEAQQATQLAETTGPMMSAQHGGIVPIAAHAGEMILPQALSQGLQRLIGGQGMPGILGGLDRMLGGAMNTTNNNRNFTFNQTNNNAFPGIGMDPRSALRAFRDTHERITGDLVRNFRAALA